MLTLLLVLAYSISPVTDRLKQALYAALSQEKWEQKAVSSFHFECHFVEGICQG